MNARTAMEREGADAYRPTPPAGTVATLLAERNRELAETLVQEAPSQRSDTALRFRARGSLQVWIAGERRGKWKDHEDGEYGDALALVAHLRRTSMREAYAWALDWLGFDGASRQRGSGGGRQAVRGVLTAEPRRRPPNDSTDLARRLWNEAVDAPGTLVETYLASRGLTLPHGAPVSFHPACPRGAERLPAMLAMMTHPLTGEPCGVHRTLPRRRRLREG